MSKYLYVINDPPCYSVYTTKRLNKRSSSSSSSLLLLLLLLIIIIIVVIIIIIIIIARSVEICDKQHVKRFYPMQLECLCKD